MANLSVAEATPMVTSNHHQKRNRPGQQQNSSFKIFLNRHGHIVDFSCATLLVCVCLIVLLPRVHDSFTKLAGANGTDGALPEDTVPTPTDATATTVQLTANKTVTADYSNLASADLGLVDLNGSDDPQAVTLMLPTDEHDHSHHHHHNAFAAGEFLVCIGFFVFYVVGISLDGNSTESFERGDISHQSRQAILRRQSTSTTCCSSTKCPPIPPYANHQAQVVESSQLISSRGQVVDELTLLAPRFPQRNPDDDCLMLLNPHHQHHTHSKHHDTAQMTTSLGVSNIDGGQAYYGSTSAVGGEQNVPRRHQTSASDLTNNFKEGAGFISKPGATIIVDEIRITSGPPDSFVALSWPRSLKMLMLSIILAAFLVLFDIKMHGWMTAIKVFRACSTGALLYVAFFIMLPRDRVGCNSCQEEEN